jgi:predicted secreted protein
MTREGEPLTVTTIGDLAEVRLPETPSTGYRWEPASGVAEVVDVRYEEQSAGRPVAGASGTRVFKVRIEDVGELVFVLRRSWEPEPLERRRITVVRG